MRFNKLKRTPDAEATLNQRYNKALVCSQLKAMFNYTNDDQMYDDQRVIMNAWNDSSKVVSDRPRFFNVRELFKLEQDLYILTSSYGSFDHNSNTYVVFQINYKGFTNFGLPVNDKIIESLGGPNTVSRLISLKGVYGLISKLEEVSSLVTEYIIKDRIKSNLMLLNQIKEGILIC
jgi:hypothetical protein